MALRYPGNHATTYSKETRTGLIGRVMGPDHDGAYHAVTDAAYDAEQDCTFADLQMLVHPVHALDRMEREA